MLKIKKAFSLVLALGMFTTMSSTAFALNPTEQNAQYVEANIAYIENVNPDGTNLNADTVDENSKVRANYQVSILTNSDSSLEIIADINGESLSIKGQPYGRTESGKTVFFDGKTSNSQYDVVNFAYVQDITVTNMYFKEVQKQRSTSSENVLKLYLKDTHSSTLDYYIIEVFDVNLDLDNDFISSLPINPLLGAWAATQFEPIATKHGEDTEAAEGYATTNTKHWICEKSYYDMGENQTHIIRYWTNTDTADVPVGGEINQYYKLQVSGKEMSFEINKDLNSSTMSYLHVDGLRLVQTSVPNTAWKSTSIDGYVQNNGSSGELSASIGVSWGLLGISYSLPISFNNGSGYVDINNTYKGYTNGVGGNYSRSIETTMNSKFKLTQIGHNFEVVSMLRDYGNTSKSSSTLKARWFVDIINAGTMEVFPYYLDHNATIRIN